MPVTTDSPPQVQDQAVDKDLMDQYYHRFFPFRQVYQWLNHSPAQSKDFGHREIAFTVDDVYVRYQAYNSAEAFKQDVYRMVPERFEIGAVYSVNPRDRKLVSKSAFRALSKELVFDIDLTDYDPVRTCCKGTDICHKCWGFITIAIQILDTAFREDFGFEHILWVYSGRRGAHAWICDARARVLDDQKRTAIATYLQVLGKGAQGKAVNLKRPFHPHIQRSFNLLNAEFQRRVLEEQDPWREPEAAKLLLSRMPSSLGPVLEAKWGSSASIPSTKRWRDIDDIVRDGSAKDVSPAALLAAKQDVIFEYLYPRLDIAVSKHVGHLLKSPFCVHPKTGRVCVPIDGRRAVDFDPLAVPTVPMLLDELNEYAVVHKGQETGEERMHDYDKTSLKPYVEVLTSFVSNLTKSEQRAKRAREGDDSLDF